MSNSQSNNSNRALSPRHILAWKHLFTLRSTFSGYNQRLQNPHYHRISEGFHIPEDRITRYPLYEWINKLQNQLNKLSHTLIVNNVDNAVESIAVVINQSSFIVALMGDIDSAYAICNKAIEYYYTVYKINDNNDLLCHAIQPWINMARLERICKNLDQSTRMFNFLSGCFPSTTRIEKIVSWALEEAKNRQNLPAKVAEQCYKIEPIINALAKRDSTALNKLLHNYHSRDFIRNPILREAEIISFFSNESYVHYNISVLTGFNLCRIQDLDVFSLRLAEYCYLIGDTNSSNNISNLIFNYCFELIEHPVNKVEHAHLILIILQSMLTFADVERAYELSIKLLDQYLELNDEPGVVAILRLICQFPQRATHTKHNIMLSEYLENTDYIFLKRTKTPSPSIIRQTEELKCALFNILNSSSHA